MPLPDFLADLFRNYRPETIDLEKHCRMVIKTVLARGTWEQVLWLFDYYGPERVREIFLQDYYGLRTLPEPTRSLWELVFVENPLPEAGDPAGRWRCRRLVPPFGEREIGGG
ncbi:MAG: hypothetical protein D9V47_10375 [Clostridia bacterium]|nr:MAG: hypothetical protein D9V47_10375 [Clostridia bacterium]